MPRHTRAVKHRLSGNYLASANGFNPTTSIIPVPAVSFDSHLWVIEPSTDGRGCTLSNLDTGRYIDVANNTVVGASTLTAGASWAVEVGEDRGVFFRHLTTGTYLAFTNGAFVLTSQRTDQSVFIYEDVEIRCVKPGSAVFAILTKDPARGVVVEIENRASYVLKLRADLGGCRNLSVAATDGRLESDRIATITVPPLSRCGFVQLSVITTPWRWGWVCAWAWAPPPPTALAEAAIASEAACRSEIQSVERLLRQRAGADAAEPLDVLCGRRGVRFVDVTFPPDASSIFPAGVRDVDRGGIPFTWQRPAAHVGAGDGEPGLVSGEAIGADVREGTLGDVWVTSGLSVLADRPGLIERLLSKSDVAGVASGVVRVRVCVDGWWKVVTLDTFLPCFPGKGLAFAHARHGAMWVSVMQKALAKEYRGYHSLTSGTIAHMFEDITGLPAAHWSVPATDHEALWAALTAGVQGGHPIAAVAPGSEVSPYCGDGDVEYELPPALKDRYAAHGFEPARGYSVLDCRVIQSETLEAQIGSWQARVVKLRNPSPRFGWTGPFANASPLWTPQLREELQVANATDGVFWMDYGSFVESFASVSIGRWAPHTRDVRVRAQFLPGGMADTMLRVTIGAQGTLVAAVQQPDLRRRGAGSRYLEIGVMVLEPHRRPQTHALVYRTVAFSGLLKQRAVHVSVPVSTNASDDPWLILPVTFRTSSTQPLPVVVTAATTAPLRRHSAVVPDERVMRAAIGSWTRSSGKPRALDHGCTVWFDLTGRLATFELRNVTEKILNFGLDLTKCVGVVSDAPDGRMKFLVEVPPRSSVPVAALLATEQVWRVAWRFMWRFLPPRADVPPLESVIDESDIVLEMGDLPPAQVQVQTDGVTASG